MVKTHDSSNTTEAVDSNLGSHYDRAGGVAISGVDNRQMKSKGRAELTVMRDGSEVYSVQSMMMKGGKKREKRKKKTRWGRGISSNGAVVTDATTTPGGQTGLSLISPIGPAFRFQTPDKAGTASQ